MIYNANAIDFLNSVVRKASRSLKVRLDTQFAMKVVSLAADQQFSANLRPYVNQGHSVILVFSSS